MELSKLEPYKIATVLQLLLSRFGHESKEVRDTLVEVLSRLAALYPKHSAWWIYHFYFFEDKSVQFVRAPSKHAITRSEFSIAILNKLLVINETSCNLIMKNKPLILNLRNLAEKEVKDPPQDKLVIEMPKSLMDVAKQPTNLVMPIEENLTP